MQRFFFAALLVILNLLNGSVSQAQVPVPDFTWNNFVGTGTFWTNANNWVPGGPPTSSIDRVLGFGSSSFQTGGGYTSTFNLGAFDLNALVFNSFGASNPSLVLTGSAAGDTLRFNTSSTGTLPSIWQVGTGRVVIQNGSATAGITLNNGTTLQIRGGGIGELQLNATIVQAGTGSSGIQINQTGAQSFITGSLVRLGGANTFAGGVNLTAGNLVIANATALGTGTFTVNGGSVQVDPASTTGLVISNPVSLNSTMLLTGNSNALAAVPTSGAYLNFSGAIGGSGGISIVNHNSNLSGGGASTMTYALTGANTFNGAINLAPIGNTTTLLTVGTATLGTGTISGTTNITLGWNSLLRLDNTATAATRLNTTTAPALTFNSSSFQVFGNATASVAETLGTMTIGGNGILTVLGNSTTAQTTSVTFASLSRPTNGTLNIIGTNLGSNTGAGESIVRFTSDPGGSIGGGGTPGSQNISILPYAIANSAASTSTTTGVANSGIVRWDSTNQKITPLTAGEYASNLYLSMGTVTANNHRYQSTSALPNASSVAGMTGSATINSLVLDTNTAATNRVGVSLSGSGFLTVTSGQILSAFNGSTGTVPSNPSMINLAGISFGSNPGYVHTPASLTINAVAQGSGGLVKAGGGTLLLNAANTFTGGLTINSGTVQFSSDSNLGAAGQAINLQGGFGGILTYLPSNLWTSANTNALTVNRPINVGTIGGVVSVSLLNAPLTLSGSISGSGQFTRTGTGALLLTGDNSSFTGTMTTLNGMIAAQNDNALGGVGANFHISSGQFQPLTSFSTNKDFMATLQAIFNTGGQNLTLNGNLTTQNANTPILKTGLGDLVITNTVTHLGQYQNGLSSPSSVVFSTTGNGVQTAGRTILSGPNGAMPLASPLLSIANGDIVLDNTSAVNNNRIGSVTVGVIGGNFTLLGNASAPVQELIGALSFSNANNPYGGTVTINTPTGSGQSTTLNALSLSSNTTGGTVFIRGTNLGATSGDRTALIFGTTPTVVNGLVPSLVVNDTANGGLSSAEPTTFARLSTITVAAPNSNQFSVAGFTAYTAAAGTLGAGAAANTYDVTAPSSFSAGAAANAIRINGTTLDAGGGTLTLSAGHILSVGGAPSTISNGTLVFGTNPARFTVNSGSDLTVSTGTTGSAGLIKSGTGVLTLSTLSTITVTAGTSFFGISQGTLRYGAANALPITPNVFINGGATLDINGTTSTVGNINGYGNVNIGNGSLTVGGIAQIVSFGGALSGSGTLILSGTQNLTLAGDSTAGFTGGVQVLGGAANTGTGATGLVIQTPGALGTGTSPILLGATSGTQQASMALAALVSTFNRDITVQAGSTPATPHTFAVGAQIVNIGSNIVLNQQLRITSSANNTGNGILNGVISGTGNLNVFFGSWTFNGNNTYSGGTTIDTGASAAIGLGVDSTATTGPLGTGTVTFTSVGANLRADGGARTINNAITMNSGAYFGTTGRNNLTLSGNIDMSAATQTVNVMSTGLTTFGGVIGNGTGLTKNGPGRLSLTGANTYSGTTTVNAGILAINNSSGSGTGTSVVNVNAGGILAGNGSLSGAVTLNSGGIIAPGNGLGTLSLSGGLSFATASSVWGVLIADGSAPAAISTGGSTIGTIPNPSSNNFLDIVSGTVTGLDTNAIISVDLTNLSFNNRQAYSYVIGRGFGDLSALNVTATNRFSFFNLSTGTISIDTFSLTGDAGGNVYLNFTPVPEPMTILAIGLTGLVVGRRLRRRVMA